MFPKVLHISTPTTWRGGEQQLAYLLEALQRAGVPQHVLCARQGKVAGFCAEKGISYTEQSERFAVDPAFAKKVKTVSRSEGIDLIHVHDSHAHTFAVMAAALFGNSLPIIVSRRVDFPISRSPLSRFKYNHPLVKRILCVSDAIRQIVAKDIRHPEVAETVYSGIDTGRFAGKVRNGKLHQMIGLAKDTPLVGNVAALAPHKDYPTFVATAQELIQRGENVHFIIIGDGPLRQETETLVAQSGIEAHIHMLGFRNDVPDLLPELDVFLITSETEGLGTSILDAFACQVPVVATQAGGIPEIVRHERTGILGNVKDPTSLADGVQRILNEAELRSTCVSGATRLLEQFTKEATAEKTKGVYREVWDASGR